MKSQDSPEKNALSAVDDGISAAGRAMGRALGFFRRLPFGDKDGEAAPKKRAGKAPKPAEEGQPRAAPAVSKRKRKQLTDRLEEATAQVAATEARLAEINERFCDPAFFQQTPREEIAALEAEHAELTRALPEQLQAWEALEREIEALPD